MKNISQLIHTAELSILLLLMTLLGTFWGYLKTFVYVYLEDLGASKLLMGLSLSFCILPSLPFLYKSAAVVQYCGHHYLIMLAFLGYCVRFAGEYTDICGVSVLMKIVRKKFLQLPIG